MNRLVTAIAAAGLAIGFAQGAAAQMAQDMTFFITSNGPGKGGDLGGLAGAGTPIARRSQRLPEPETRHGGPISAPIR